MNKELPKGWEWKTLSEIVSSKKHSLKRGPFGGSLKKEIFVSKGYKVYEQKNAIYNDFKIGNYFITLEKYNEMKAFSIKPNDIIISCSGTIGKTAIVPKDVIPGIINQALMKISLNPKIAIPRFIKYLLDSPSIQRQMFQTSIGSAIKNVSAMKRIKSIKFPNPPLLVQQRITTILDMADGLHQKRKEVNELADQFLQSVFLEMFGDPVKNPKGWDVVTLGNICTSIKDGPHVSPNYVEKGIPFISVHNIINGFFNLSDLKYISKEDHKEFCKRCKPEKGDVLYSKGGTTGIAKKIDVDFEFGIWVHLALLKFPTDQLNGAFLENCLNSNYCRAQAKRYTRGIANRDLVLSQMAKIKIILPPLPIQRKFSSIVERFEMIKDKNNKNEDELNNLFSTLLQRAFTGELTAKWEEEHQQRSEL